MSQVRVLLRGGLGNQLFQYAAGRALAERNAAKLILDLSWFDQFLLGGSATITPRSYALAPFGVAAETYQPLLSHCSGRGGRRIVPTKVVNYIEVMRRRCRMVHRYKEKSFSYDASFSRLNGSLEIDGYWQSEKYFNSVASKIRHEIGIPRQLGNASAQLLSRIVDCNSICVHVRRGDYVRNSAAAEFHGTCSEEYYCNAVSIMSRKIRDPVFFIFSDEPDWVRKNIIIDGSSVVVDVNGPEEAHQDLWLMAACKHFVIANSSLSWWAAWLGRYPEKEVIAPSRWFLSNSLSTADLLPEAWRII